jgi:hypothetical protein
VSNEASHGVKLDAPATLKPNDGAGKAFLLCMAFAVKLHGVNGALVWKYHQPNSFGACSKNS